MNKYFRILSCFWLVLIFFNLNSIYAQTAPSYYYVATNGNDSNPGTELLPWKTLGKATSMATAGTTVFIRQGTYNDRLVPVNSGTSEEPIVFASYPGDTATINGVGIEFPSGQSGDRWWNGLVYVEGLSYIKISGLKIINSEASGILVRNSSYVTIEKNYMDNTYSPGIDVNASENIIVEANEVVRGCTGNDQECISFALTNFFEIKNNSIHDGFTEGIDVKVGSTNGVVCNNEVFNQSYRFGIYIDAWSIHEFNIDIFDNISHDNLEGFGVASENEGLIEGIKIHNNLAYNNTYRGIWVAGGGIGQTHPFKSIKIFCNTVYNNRVGISITAWEGTNLDSLLICNNLIFHNQGGGLSTNYEAPAGPYLLKNIDILNNTICENGISDNGWADGGINITNITPENFLIRNNIISGNTAYTICVQPDVPADSVTIDYNFIDVFKSFLHETAGTNPVYGTPLFVNPSGYDFHLQAASAAIDKGDPGQQYNDPEDPGNPGNALSPAFGAIRNDMGAYGGPFASSWDPDSYATIPPAPVQVFPISDATGVPTALLLGWNGQWGATSYRLQVSTNSGFSTTVIDSSGIKGSSCAIIDLANNTQYYWRINATNAAGTGSFSGIWSFTTTMITGINDQISDEAIRIYPVPAFGILKIEGIENELTTISVLSLESKLIKQIRGRGIREIDIQGLLKGVYLVKISNPRAVITKKIVRL